MIPQKTSLQNDHVIMKTVEMSTYAPNFKEKSWHLLYSNTAPHYTQVLDAGA